MSSECRIYSLIVHTGFTYAEIALGCNGRIIDSHEILTRALSADLLVGIEKLLTQNGVALKQLSFIAAHQGPAPFTSLRVSLATVNGLGFACRIPLIGVNGLEEFLEEQKSSEYPVVVLLNAFSKEVYYAVYDAATGACNFGIAQYHKYLEDLRRIYARPIAFVGNGADLYRDAIRALFGDDAIMPDQLPQLVSLQTICSAAYKQYSEGHTVDELFPLYMKAPVNTVSTSHC